MANDFEKGLRLQVQAPFSFPWAEYVGRDGNSYTQSYRFSKDQTQASWTIDVYWSDFIGNGLGGFVVPEILGYSKRLVVPPFTPMISRQIPIAHRQFPWLYAVSIDSVQGIKFIGKSKANMAKYERARLTIGFTTLPFSVLNDGMLALVAAGDESQRYVTKLTKPTVDYISVERGMFRFAEGPANNPAYKQFQLGTGRLTTKVDLEWIWHEVPDDCLFSATGLASNILDCVGTVNQNAIWGYPAGTLLCLPPTFTPVTLPVAPNLMGYPGFTPPRAWNVSLMFKYWDPPLGAGATTRGHRTAMYVNDMLFYAIKSVLLNQAEGAPLGNYLFEATDFSNIFKSL
jgi:hypothetical protein